MTPDEKLAEIIVDRLIAEGAIAEDRREEAVQRIANGSAQQDDWRLWVEDGPRGQASVE